MQGTLDNLASVLPSVGMNAIQSATHALYMLSDALLLQVN